MRFLRQFILTFLILTFIALNAVGFAREGHEDSTNHRADPVEELSAEEKSQLEKLQQKSQLEENLLFLKRLEDEYNYSLSGFKQISQTLEDTKAKLIDVHSQGVTLKEQLYYLDKLIEISKKKVLAISRQLANKTSHLAILEAEIDEQEAMYEKQRDFMADYLNFIYLQENNYFGSNNNELDAFRFLLADTSSSQAMNELGYFEILNQSSVNVMDDVKQIESNLSDLKKEMEEEKLLIESLDGALKSEQRQLVAQKEAKTNLLKQTRGEEEIYLELLKGAKEEQEQAREELLRLKSNLDIIRNKIRDLGTDFDPGEYKNLLDDTSRELYEFYLSASNNEGVSKMAWPVLPAPGRGLTSYFRDEAYRARFGLVHNAIDIPVPQSTTARAPLDCVVYKTQDNGMGYSYLILACKGGYLLTFGHVSEFLVAEGQRVKVGQPVALTGGMPGTKGAGHLTTGPHLHFEVMVDGKYKDPLDYLDISILPYDTLLDKYKDRLREKVRKKSAER